MRGTGRHPLKQWSCPSRGLYGLDGLLANAEQVGRELERAGGAVRKEDLLHVNSDS